MTNRLRDLPAVHEVLSALDDLAPRFPRELMVRHIRAALDAARVVLRASDEEPVPDVSAIARRSLEALEEPSLRRVINATGVILHTNLGRAPLPGRGYCNLEYDLAAGRRGKRDVHVSRLIEELVGAPGIAVNNNAAAVFLALNEIAAGGEVIVSRGELIEIGDGFRIPDIMQRSGAVLREVGTTNRTRIEDYRSALSERTRMLMIVHRSNFRIEGFTAKPARRDLAELAREAGLPLYEDLGSGCLADLGDYGVDEPRPADSIAEGVSLVSFSGDKLLGGPQAGILAGDAELVARLRRNPMFRALRLDKLILEALETTLRNTLLERWDAIPALAMIRQSGEALRRRALDFLTRLGGGELVRGESLAGGGSTPEQPLPGWLIAVKPASAAAFERRLRTADPPVVARVEDDRVLIDLRTVLPEEEPALLAALARAASK